MHSGAIQDFAKMESQDQVREWEMKSDCSSILRGEFPLVASGKHFGSLVCDRAPLRAAPDVRRQMTLGSFTNSSMNLEGTHVPGAEIPARKFETEISGR